jgi:hypothetical protein
MLTVSEFTPKNTSEQPQYTNLYQMEGALSYYGFAAFAPKPKYYAWS